MFSGCKINSSLAPNSYPSKLRHSKTALLAKEVYDYLVSNDYSFKKPLKGVELFDSLIESWSSSKRNRNLRRNQTHFVGQAEASWLLWNQEK
jgi:hypothetical protein